MNSTRHNAVFVEEELERRILHGISCEWDVAADGLNESYREMLRKPSFSIRDLRKWGYWSCERQEICLSRNLVRNHSWDAVREVLIHEMAHQFAEQVLGADREPPHGQSFKKACYLLRANPDASGKCKALDERILHDSYSPEDKIMGRIRKLMALAQSKNRHEAEAAMAKAYEFIEKYNVDLLAREENRAFVSIFVGKPALRHFREHYFLSRLLQDFYFVFGIWVPAYVLGKGKMGQVLEITGTMQNVRIASYVHDFVQRFIDSQWQEYNKGKRLNRYRKTDFAVGIIEGFRLKLKSQSGAKRATRDHLALVATEDPQLEEYVRYRYTHIRRVRGKPYKTDPNVEEDGRRVGKKLVIHKGIEERQEKGKHLLRERAYSDSFFLQDK
jgi:hypothetical protein